MNNNKKVVELPLEDVLPNRFQPRIKFNEESIIELCESIKEHGVIQPIVVRPVGDKYEIIAGERRYKASTMAGLTVIPAIITDLNDKDSAEVALIENVQRKDLTPIEEAISYKKILDMGYLTQEKLADKLGKKQSTIANKLRLLNLDEDVQEALLEDKISERHARSLLKLTHPEAQKLILKRIIAERLTVRKTDEEINNMLNGNYPRQTVEAKDEVSVKVQEEPFDFSKLDFLSNPEVKEQETYNSEPTFEIPKFEDLFTQISEDKSILLEESKTDEEDQKQLEPVNDEVYITNNNVENIEETNNNMELESTNLVEAPAPFVFNDLFIDEKDIIEDQDEYIEQIEYIDDLDEVNKIEEEPFDFSKLDFLTKEDETQENSTNEELESGKKIESTGTNTYVANDIKTVVNTIHNCAETIMKYGFTVEVDEIELDGEYRVTFVIKK